MSAKTTSKFDVFKVGYATKLLLEKQYSKHNTIRNINLELFHYEAQVVLADGDTKEDFLERLDELINSLQAIRQDVDIGDSTPK